MPYITNRFKSARYDEMRELLFRRERRKVTVAVRRRDLAEAIQELRQIEADILIVQDEIIKGEPDEAELPIMVTAEANADAREHAAGNGNGHAPAKNGKTRSRIPAESRAN